MEDVAALAPGFADPAQDTAAVFRAALDAMARPGQVRPVAPVVPPAGLSPAAAALLLMLADGQTPVWMPEAEREGPAGWWLRFHTGAPPALRRSEAVLAVGPWQALLPLADWPAGEPAYPDRSATLIVEVPGLTGGPVLTLTGPGISGTVRFCPDLPDGGAQALRLDAARFPLGLDFFFASGPALAALPRSTRIGS